MDGFGGSGEVILARSTSVKRWREERYLTPNFDFEKILSAKGLAGKGLSSHLAPTSWKLVLVFDIDNEPWQPTRAVETTTMIHFHR